MDTVNSPDAVFSYFLDDETLPGDDTGGVPWPAEIIALTLENDSQTANLKDGASVRAHMFKIRNPYENADSVRITWNGCAGDEKDQVLAQSFIAGKDGPLTQVSLKVKKDGVDNNFSGRLKVFLKTGYGGEKDTILAESEFVDISNLPDREYVWVDVAFPEPYVVSTGQAYFLEIASPAHEYSGLRGEPIYWAYAPDNSYADGNGFYRDACSWFQLTESFQFKTYVANQVDQQPTGECSTCSGTDSMGWLDEFSSIPRVFDYLTGSWDFQGYIDHDYGYDDVTFEKTFDLAGTGFQSEDGWVSIQVLSGGGPYGYPMHCIATDLFYAEFIQTFSGSPDPDGSYIIQALPDARYVANITAPGYRPHLSELQINSGEASTLDVSLVRAPLVGITIETPADGEFLEQSYYEVRGTVSEPAAVTVNGVSAHMWGDNDTNFWANVNLSHGENTITVTAVGQYGQVSSESVTVTVNAQTIINGTVTFWHPVNQYITGLPAATVLLIDASGVEQSVSTNQIGYYEFLSVATGAYSMTVSKSGFESAHTAGTITYGRTVTHDFYMHLKPSVSLTASPDTIHAGESSVLSWTTGQADTVEIDQGIGLQAELDGSITVSPMVTTTYTATATGSGGTTTATATVTVLNPPTVSFDSNPETIRYGDSAILTWSTAGADSCEIDPGIGSVDLNGTLSVSPTETTAYTLTATGAGGITTLMKTVMVLQPPVVSMDADPTQIMAGGSATLNWSATGADTCSIAPEVGPVSPSGSLEISPGQTTTYTLTADGPGGTTGASVTITVNHSPPTVTISASPETIVTNQSAVLTWSATNADMVTISDIGPVDANGTIAVTPDRMRTYTIEATGAGGTSTATAKVFVYKGNRYDYGDPTPAEQAHLEAVNRARLNPTEEAARLGIDLNEGLAPGTISPDPVQPLVFNAKLAQAAHRHAQDMMVQQYMAHESPDGRVPSDRMREAGYSILSWGENLGLRVSLSPLSETDTILAIHDDLFVDQGVDGRGHRVSILNNSFREAGLGGASGAFNGYPHAHMLTCDFGASSWENNAFLLGVVYDDANPDGIYTAGEGIGGVTITIQGTDYETLTAAAGGYGMPLPPGTYEAIATLPNGDGVVKEFTIADQNLKLDFLLSEFTAPPGVAFSADQNIITLGGTANLSWSVTNADTVSIDNGIGSAAAADSTVVSPADTVTYTLTARGPGGVIVKALSVYVIDPAALPVAEISAAPETVSAGASTTLSWHVTDADTVSIDNGIGSVDPVGTLVVTPAATTTYTVSGSGPGGNDTASVTITVTHPQPTAALSAAPLVITAGGSTTLSWDTTGADTVTLAPGIGSVSPTGTLSLTPALSTLYTLSAVGPGGSDTASVQVSVIHPKPVINFSAAAETILSGESALLSWEVTGADTVSIDSGIGGVASTGSTGVTPSATTTYTLTATNPGGSKTGTVTITVTDPTDPPVVALGASPEVILSGESAVLSWNVVNATTISIDNGVGDVGANGTLSISPTQTTTCTLSATGPGGTTTGSVTVRISAIGIAITAPTDGQVISRPDVMVRGTFTNPGGIETGITVNGVLAAVYGNEFVANHVPLQAGENTITVTATGDDGDVNDASVTVSREPATDYIRMVATSESGVAPLETTLRVDGTFSFTAGQPSYTGPGTVEFLGTTEENEFNVIMTTEGVYSFTTEVQHENVTYQAVIVITVLNRAELDTFLQAKWAGLKTALGNGNIEDSMDFISSGAREMYGYNLNLLSGHLSEISACFHDVSFIRAQDGTAEYNVLCDQDGTKYSFYLLFNKDADGIWRIKFF